INVPPHSMIVFDRAYNHYLQFAKWAHEKVNFVCRKKSNAIYNVLETSFIQQLPKGQTGVLKEQFIEMTYKDENKVEKKLILRKVDYRDKQRRTFEFITNNFNIS